MSTYIIETRTPATGEREAGPWHSDGMGTEPIEVASLDEGHVVVQALRGCGPDWEAAEYRIVPKGSARELVRMLAARGGVSAVIAEVLDANLDEADRREAEHRRRGQ